MTRTLLCADDSPTIQKVVELTFADSDIRVVCVSDGDTAIQRFRELRPDVLLLDVVMPVRSGYEVCEFIKREGGAAAPGVLLLSTSFEPYDAERARQSGADGHLPKPFESRALLDKVHALMDRPAAAEDATLRSGALEGASATDPGGDTWGGENTGPGPASALRDTLKQLEELDEVDRINAAGAGSGSEAAAPSPRRGPALSAAEIDAIARRVVELISPDIVREVAWEVVPDLVDMLVRQRLDEQDPTRGRQR